MQYFIYVDACYINALHIWSTITNQSSRIGPRGWRVYLDMIKRGNVLWSTGRDIVAVDFALAEGYTELQSKDKDLV